MPRVKFRLDLRENFPNLTKLLHEKVYDRKKFLFRRGLDWMASEVPSDDQILANYARAVKVKSMKALYKYKVHIITTNQRRLEGGWS